MEIYYINFALLIFAALIFDTFPSRLTRLFEFALFFLLAVYIFLFAGLRTMGLEFDYSVYKRVFEEIANISELGKYSGYKVEYAYMLLNRIFSGFSFHTFIFALCFITVLPKQVYIYRHCSRKFLALAYYYALVFIQNDMGLLRAGAASGILYYGFDFLSRDEKYKFIFMVFLASFFHITSLLMLMLLIPGSKKYTMREYLLILGLGLLISLMHLGMPLLEFVSKHFTTGESISGKLQHYYEIIAEGGGNVATVRLFLSNARKIVIFAMFSYLMKISHSIYSSEKCKLLQVWYNSYFVSILFPILFMDLGGLISHRGALLFRPVEIFLFSELSEAIGRRRISRLEIFAERFLLFLFMTYLCIHNINDVIYGYDGFIPYKWEF